MTPNIHTYEDANAVATAFAEEFAAKMPQSGTISVALSGGSTPRILFQLWAEKYRSAIPWNRIHMYWGDERCVPPDHADSNYRMTRELLLDVIDIPEANVHRILGEADPAKEADRYGNVIQEMLPVENGWPVFDWILLGMGGDGHTASIFANSIDLLHADSVCATATHPESGQVRVSLTGAVLNAAKRVSFLITGQGKAGVLREVITQTGAWESYPAAHIAPAGLLDFYLDQAAASEL